MSKIRVTYMPARNKPHSTKRISTTDRNLYRAVTRERFGSEKNKMPLWSPCIFHLGKKADNENSIEISCLVWDFDIGLKKDVVLEVVDRLDFAYFAHSSWSNSIACDKFRIVLPLAEPICSVDWEYAWTGALELLKSHMPEYAVNCFGDNIIDTTCSDARRFYYVGGAGVGPIWSVQKLNRRPLDLVPIMETTRERMVREMEERKARIDREHAAYMAKQEKKKGEHRDFNKELFHKLKNTEQERRRFANMMSAFGGKIIIGPKSGDEMCVDWICPKCKNIKNGKYDPATYFYISPYRKLTAAYCQHRKSCGYYSSLYWLGHEYKLIK